MPHPAEPDRTEPHRTAPDSVVGTWGDHGGNQPQLVVSVDGSLSGTDGCNRLFGTWELSGDTISFVRVGSTMMACQGVDTWLAGLDSARVDGDTLHVADASGFQIGVLTRASE